MRVSYGSELKFVKWGFCPSSLHPVESCSVILSSVWNHKILILLQLFTSLLNTSDMWSSKSLADVHTSGPVYWCDWFIDLQSELGEMVEIQDKSCSRMVPESVLWQPATAAPLVVCRFCKLLSVLSANSLCVFFNQRWNKWKSKLMDSGSTT